MSAGGSEGQGAGRRASHAAIRRARAGDASRVAALVEAHALFAAYGWTADDLQRALAQAMERDHLVLVAEVGAEPAGFVWCVPEGAFARSGYVRLLVVAPASMGAGVADALMAAAEDEMFAKARDVFLLVNEGNRRAQRFYERRGYVCVGEIEDYVAEGHSERIYRKTATALER